MEELTLLIALYNKFAVMMTNKPAEKEAAIQLYYFAISTSIVNS
jgi:hypothetical protein